MRTLLRLGLALGAVVVAAAIVTAASAQPAPQQQQQQTQERSKYEVKVTPEMVRHSRIQNILYFAGFAYGLAILFIVLATGLSRRMRDWAAGITKRPFLIAMLYIVFFTIATTLLSFPLDYYGDFVVPHQFDLSDQSFGSWMVDQLKGLGLSILIGSIIGALALLGIRKVKRWWVVLWLGTIPLTLLLVVVAPVLLDPVFNKFEPLKDQVLKQELLDLASKAGIEGGRVYQVNKSKQTKTMNAYVTGIGPTKRIVLWDTIIAKMTHRELLGVMGHEMGHYVLNHLWKGIGLTAVLSFFVFFVGQLVYDRGLGRWGITGPGDPASLPWLLIILSVITFLGSPVSNGISRYFEHQSDVFSLELTHDNDALAIAFIKLSEDSKQIPRPHPFIEFWRYSHPSIGNRIDFVLSYKPWEKGEPNQAWKPKSDAARSR